jgi:hypothetical protein
MPRVPEISEQSRKGLRFAHMYHPVPTSESFHISTTCFLTSLEGSGLGDMLRVPGI